MTTAPAAAKRELTKFFAGTYGITWGIAAFALLAPNAFTGLFGNLSTSSPVYYIAVYSPSITALALTAIRDGGAGIVRLLARLKPRVSSLPYYLAVLVGWPVIGAVALFLQGFITGAAAPTIDYGHWYLAPVFLLTRLVVDAGPLGEELGWRGYALPRLLDRKRSSVIAALLLGVVWGIWHLPAFFVAGTAQHDQGLGILWLITGTTLASVVMTWIYRRTGGDVLAAGVLVHLMNNVMPASLPFVDLVYAPLALAAGIALHNGDRKRRA